MKLDLLFDVARHSLRPETTDSDMEIVVRGEAKTINPKQQAEIVRRSIQAFIHGYGASPADKKKDVKIQAFWGSSDLPDVTKDVFNVYNQVPEYDLYWQEAFKGIKLSKGELEWEIDTITSATEFKLIPEGGKVEFGKYEGAAVTVKIQKYGLGIGVTWETIEGKKLHKFVQQMEDVRSKLYNLWANVHYGLLATAGATNVITWQGSTDQSTVDRDIQTINKGYEDLGEAVKDSGYGEVANARMLIYASPKLKSRIMAALRAVNRQNVATNAGVTGSADTGQVVEYNVEPRFTWNSNITANTALLVLPGHKIQNSVYLSELGLSKKDIESLNELRTYWTAFGAVVGDNDQVYQLNFS